MSYVIKFILAIIVCWLSYPICTKPLRVFRKDKERWEMAGYCEGAIILMCFTFLVIIFVSVLIS